MEVNDDFINIPKFADLGRSNVNDFVKGIAKILPAGTSLLDAGAGECAYKVLFKHCNYKSIDLGVGDDRWHYEHLDFVGPLDSMPIEDSSFDAVMCTQVLEHLQKPLESIKEMYRVLKDGGRIFITVPMAQGEHQAPYDFFRYTSFGLRYLFENAGFKEIEIEPMGGFFYRWAYEMPEIYSFVPRVGFKYGKINIKGILILPVRAILPVFVRLMQYALVKLDKIDKNSKYPWGWKVSARKKTACDS